MGFLIHIAARLRIVHVAQRSRPQRQTRQWRLSRQQWLAIFSSVFSIVGMTVELGNVFGCLFVWSFYVPLMSARRCTPLVSSAGYFGGYRRCISGWRSFVSLPFSQGFDCQPV